MNQLQQSAKRLDDQCHGFTAARQRILVIEDDPDISHLLEIHLRDNAYQVDVVGNGIDGLERASKHPYQLIVLDLMLPGIDGLEVCRRLRQDKTLSPGMKIIAMTAHSNKYDRETELASGADEYLVKPFDMQTLQDHVEKLL